MNIDKSKEGHCDYNDFKRARYFDGEILNKQIFVAEQFYHNEKRKLLNRMLHGWGVVCGLKVKSTNPPSSNIIIEPGMALDCHGNEILICNEQMIDLSAKTCIQKTQTNPCLEDIEMEDTVLYVVIRYKEIESDSVPSYAPSGNCEEGKSCDYSRMKEGFCIEILDKLPSIPKLKSTDLLCSEPFKCPACCLDPHYIVLATISCGKRIDRIFSECELRSQKGECLNDKNGNPVKIRYQITRKLPRVCISGMDKTTDFEDSYSFETDQDFDYEWSWEINTTKLDERVTDTTMDPSKETIFKISNYGFDPKGTKGSSYIEIPVTLSFLGSDKNPFANCSLTLQSPIYIGSTKTSRGSIISDAMIRNMENRQIVITYPLLSWLLSSSGMRDLQLSPCNLVDFFSELMSIVISRKREKVQPVVTVKSFEEVKGKLAALEADIGNVSKDIDNTAKKITNETYKLRNEITKLEKKFEPKEPGQ